MPIRRPLPVPLLILACVVAAAAAPARSQTLSPAPQEGLWETQASVLVNGSDAMAGVRRMQEAAMAALPPAQRQQMAAMMAAHGGPLAGNKTMQCLAAADVARITRPEEALAQLQRNAPKCRFEQPVVQGSVVDFKGRCADPQGFSGDVTGSFTMDSPSAWHGLVSGKGRIPRAEQIPGLKMGPDGQVDLQLQTRSTWLSADCGAVQPLGAGR